MRLPTKIIAVTFLSIFSFSVANALLPTLPDTGIVGTTIQGSGDTIVLTFDTPVAPVDGTWSTNEFEAINNPTTTPRTLTNAQFSPTTGTTTTLTITLNETTDNSFLTNGTTILVRPASSTIVDNLGEFVEAIDIISTSAITGDVSSPLSCSITFTSNNASSTLARPTNTLTVSFCSNEKLRAATIMIASRLATTTNTGGNNWQGVLVASSSENDGILSFTINFTDLAGNAGSQLVTTSNSAYVRMDKTPPTATVTISTTTIAATTTATTTITFSERVTGFDNTDITTITGGTLSTVTTADNGITWTALFTPASATTSTSSLISIDVTGITDIAGNAGTTTVHSNTYLVDTLSPTLVITSTDLDVAAADAPVVSFTFSEAVLGFDNTDIFSIENGTLGAATTTDGGRVWTAIFSPSAATNIATNAIKVALAGITDIYGNIGVGTTTSPNYAVNSLIASSGGGGGGGGGQTFYDPFLNLNLYKPTGEVLGVSNSVYAVTKTTFIRNLDVGARGADVTELQKILIAEGLHPANPSGYFGVVTKRALMKWQKKNNLPPTGYFGTLTRKVFTDKSTTATTAMNIPPNTPTVLGATALAYPAVNLELGSRGEDVKMLQTFLINEGFLQSEASGYFGVLTKNALAKWQEKYNLPPLGYYGSLTRATIKKIKSELPTQSTAN